MQGLAAVQRGVDVVVRHSGKIWRDPRWRFITETGMTSSGKTSIFDQLQAHDPNLRKVPSVTTRPSRPEEIRNGTHYIFVSVTEFAEMKAERKFAWVAPSYNGFLYATRKEDLLKAACGEYPSLLDVEPSSLEKLRGMFLRPLLCSAFVSIRDEAVLEARLRKRDQGQPDAYYKQRIEESRWYNKWAEQNPEDLLLIDNSGDLEDAVQVFANHLWKN